jgi:hypothetical protein
MKKMIKKFEKIYEKINLNIRQVCLLTMAAASLVITLPAASLAAPPASARQTTGISGNTYETTCDSNNVCSTAPASLIIYVYDSQSTNPLFNFTSSRRGTFKQALAAGQYTLKGSPNCGFTQCILPSGNVSINVVSGYLNLSLTYDPSLGLTGGAQ